MKIISVVLPVYNAAGTIQRCIDSVLAQHYPYWELLAVDDGSTDASLDELRAYASKDARIKVFSIPNSGPSAARNVGLKNASGDYLCFIDADDFVTPNYLLVLYTPFENSDVQLVCGGYYEISRTSTVPIPIGKLAGLPSHGQISAELLKKALFKGTTGLICSKMFETAVLRQHNILFREPLRLFEDLVFTLEYSNFIKNIELVDQSIYYYYKTSDSSLSATRDLSILKNSALANQYILEAYHGEDRENIVFCRIRTAIHVYAHSEAVAKQPLQEKLDHISSVAKQYHQYLGHSDHCHGANGLSRYLLRSGNYLSYIAWRKCVQALRKLKFSIKNIFMPI